MLFNSYAFIFGFLPITLLCFFATSKFSHRLAELLLVVASLFFYGWYNQKYVFLLLTLIVINYLYSYAISCARQRSASTAKTILTVSIINNLGLLIYFKYANFFIVNIGHMAGIELKVLNVVLPLGVSFFTFTQIAFLVDVYRGIAREYSFIRYALFVIYFPHLIAGPMLHHKQIIPQFERQDTYKFSLNNFSAGLTVFIIGLAKKVLLADQLAYPANQIFDAVTHGGTPMLAEAWIGAFAYTLQIYFDFSGYSDMAVGLSRMFNIHLPVNFYSPYKARNIIEFWHRWHMTLSIFLRDYLYVSLGGNRRGTIRRYVNLMVTMLLGGLWHGAGWTFVLWGGLHGLYLVVNHGWRYLFGADGASLVWRLLWGWVTFIAVVFAWVPFRAPDFDTAIHMFAGMLGGNGVSLPINFVILFKVDSSMVKFLGLTPLSGLPAVEYIVIFLGLLIVWFLPNTQQWIPCYKFVFDAEHELAKGVQKQEMMYAVGLGLLMGMSLLSLNRASDFLYFQF
ncbi:MAG: MBOAT family protein [Magnetococcales bacterium]|nr:MBOAT family protein [Magnetococcales bacterium]